MRLRSLIKSCVRRAGLWPMALRTLPVVAELDVHEAYRLWAPTYATETATSFLDDELAQEMLTELPRRRLLDAGCGVGRRIHHIQDAVGIDLSTEMLAAGGARNVVAGDIRSMPFENGRFDMVWCRLVLGHLPDPLHAYMEISRVCMPGAYVFVTDFHPDAAAAGHRRTLTDEAGNVHSIEHYVHTDHAGLGARAGLDLVATRDGAVGPSIRDFYVRGIGIKAYTRDKGLKLVAAFVFHKPEARGTGLNLQSSLPGHLQRVRQYGDTSLTAR